MSTRTLPLVFINLGGEMLYILDQRLQAQNTSVDNSEKGVWSENDRKRVMSDIVGTMFSKAFMDELLKPQQLYSHRTMKTVLTRLAHTSIMRLNPASMEKLYELMVMAFKYQVYLCPRPKDLLLITYNHMDAIREFVRDTPAVANQVDETHRKLIEVYSPLSEGEFQLLRQTLLIFFQDMHVRVSLLLKNQIQKPNGRFTLATSGPVPHAGEVPGLIRLFDVKGRESPQARREHVHNELSRGDAHGQEPCAQPDDVPNLLAKEELNLLARIMGSMKTEHDHSAEGSFRLNLFASDQEEEEAGSSGGARDFEVINIQAMQDEQAAAELARIAGQFAEEECPTYYSGGSLVSHFEPTTGLVQPSLQDSMEPEEATVGVEVVNSIRERTIAENSMVVLLQGLQGEVTTVDLRDESSARGLVLNVDAFMNIRLKDVLFRDRRGQKTQLQDLFITGRNVRYVHIPDHVDIMKTIESQLAKIHRVRNFAGEGGGRKEFSGRKK
ncbi:hypothetical protein OJAV_G00109410 [Oryzias javanicus]|uniref:Sm domain-containing protein n=1 Tax=Oryzias javanicus TaxID=123683 RepID=A0A437CW58_ORYJA|nr:hypothetical protein OJAV_G00109410 [Oryzias javanicus]